MSVRFASEWRFPDRMDSPRAPHKTSLLTQPRQAITTQPATLRANRASAFPSRTFDLNPWSLPSPEALLQVLHRGKVGSVASTWSKGARRKRQHAHGPLHLSPTSRRVPSLQAPLEAGLCLSLSSRGWCLPHTLSWGGGGILPTPTECPGLSLTSVIRATLRGSEQQRPASVSAENRSGQYVKFNYPGRSHP